jgi:hypothetical protein
MIRYSRRTDTNRDLAPARSFGQTAAHGPPASGSGAVQAQPTTPSGPVPAPNATELIWRLIWRQALTSNRIAAGVQAGTARDRCPGAARAHLAGVDGVPPGADDLHPGRPPRRNRVIEPPMQGEAEGHLQRLALPGDSAEAMQPNESQRHSPACHCGCREPHPRHATRRYSLIRPPTRACLGAQYCSRSIGSGSGFSGAAPSSGR